MPLTITPGRQVFSCCSMKNAFLLPSFLVESLLSGATILSLSGRPCFSRTCLSFRSLMGFGCDTPKYPFNIDCRTLRASMLRCSCWMASMSSFTEIYAMSGAYTSLMYSDTCPRVVFSISPLTILALVLLSSRTSEAVMIGVEIFLAALIISLSLGTPRVTFMEATPAKWKVFRVICVPGSEMLCAPIAPTASPGSTQERRYFRRARSSRAAACEGVSRATLATSSAPRSRSEARCCQASTAAWASVWPSRQARLPTALSRSSAARPRWSSSRCSRSACLAK
mmetsp:Transcript_35166/g.57794  ORF Transcript_35166/g.57794 Transcript_35166/m.57794 type:complete len:282 (+) Transcript_35166:558-1403(+)